MNLSDVISLGKLAPGVKVIELMDTERGILCYRYWRALRYFIIKSSDLSLIFHLLLINYMFK